MKQTLGSLILICGLSLSVQAKFFNFERPGFKCSSEREFSARSNFDVPLPDPKYVFSEGEYHPITSNTYPFYTTHDLSSFIDACYNPNTPPPLGTLWKRTISENSYRSRVDNRSPSFSFNYKIDITPAYKLCSGCKRSASAQPSTAFHLKNSEKMVYYFNGM